MEVGAAGPHRLSFSICGTSDGAAFSKHHTVAFAIGYFDKGIAMLKELDAVALMQFHDERLGVFAWPGPATSTLCSGVWRWIEANHHYNTLLWDEEDQARRTDVTPDRIAASKRLIDLHNQQRNDAVERIDEELLAQLADTLPMPGARLSSETAGGMIDRLSILALKVLHMRAQTRRDDAGQQHIAACTVKLMRLETQRHDLACCLDRLLQEAAQGRSYFKVYRQFKMYNDPALNPYLSVAAGSAMQARGEP